MSDSQASKLEEPVSESLSFLRFMAVVLIIFGAAAAVAIWIEFAIVEVQVGTYSDITVTELHLPGAALAIGVALQGALIGMLVFVFANLVGSVGRIERHLTAQAVSTLATDVDVEAEPNAGQAR